MMKQLIYIILYIFTSTVLFNCKSEEMAEKAEKIEHSKKRKIYDLSFKQSENIQSPINLQSSLAKDHHHQLEIHINPHLTALKQKGHTIELKMTDDSYVKSSEYLYIFKQLHFHTPAEHSIDQVKNPMEVHLVSVRLDTLGMEISKYLVVGITFTEGEDSPFIQAIIDKFPKHIAGELEHGQEDVLVRFPDQPIDLNLLFGDAIENHLEELYHYKGSLTTPPYTESVQWYVLKKTVEASKEQIELMQERMGENAREGQQKTHLEIGFGNLMF